MIKIDWSLVAFGAIFGTMVVTLGLSFSDAYDAAQRNDVCIESGGIYVKTYGEYKCYSTDFRTEYKITK